MMAKTGKKKPVMVVGDYVLLGSPGITMPSDWYFGKVIWVHEDDIVVHRWSGGNEWRDLVHIDLIRAAGTIPGLNEYKRVCTARVRKHQKRVRDLERSLGAARDAVFRELDEIAEAR